METWSSSATAVGASSRAPSPPGLATGAQRSALSTRFCVLNVLELFYIFRPQRAVSERIRDRGPGFTLGYPSAPHHAGEARLILELGRQPAQHNNRAAQRHRERTPMHGHRISYGRPATGFVAVTAGPRPVQAMHPGFPRLASRPAGLGVPPTPSNRGRGAPPVVHLPAGSRVGTGSASDVCHVTNFKRGHGLCSQ